MFPGHNNFHFHFFKSITFNYLNKMQIWCIYIILTRDIISWLRLWSHNSWEGQESSLEKETGKDNILS